jgi:biotin carboxylase
LQSFARAIAAAHPDLIVSGDDLATQHLHRLHARETRNGTTESPISALIERSLGSAQCFPIAAARGAFIDAAREQGVRVPATRVIRNFRDLRDWVEQIGLPVVLKANGTSGGDGVKIAHSVAEAEGAFRRLQAPPLPARAAKRALFDRDRTLVWPAILRERRRVNAQAFVEGHEATSTVFCWQGAILAGLHFEVAYKASAAGHATVVRLIENAEMSAAVERMAARLGLSGFYGFDFMLEAATGHAYLIEINPRATQVGHLSLGAGRDLPAALFAALTGNPVQPRATVTDKETIALFPQEWTRDPESPLLQSAYHDVPWEEAELVRACIASRSRQSAWYSRHNPASGYSQARHSEPAMAELAIAELKSRAAGLN